MIEVVVVAIAVGAFVKGMTGFGLPQIAIPAMAIFLGVEHAVIVLAIPGALSNAWLIWSHREARHERPEIATMLVAGSVGAVAGTMLLKSLDSRLLSVVLGLLILLYIAIATLRPSFSIPRRVSRVVSPAVGLLGGGMQGSTGISGPLLTTYLHGLRLSASSYVFTISLLFMVFSIFQIGALVGLGAYTPALVAQSFLVLVPIAVMLPVGAWARHHVSATVFRRIVLVLLAVTAIKLLYDALT